MSLNLNTLRDANNLRQAHWDPEVKLTGLFHSNELAEETGEACGVVKKLVRQELGLVGSRKTTSDLADELADVLIVADLLARKYNINLGDAVIRKFNEVSVKLNLKVLISNNGERILHVKE